jgi:hypothetical protein
VSIVDLGSPEPIVKQPKGNKGESQKWTQPVSSIVLQHLQAENMAWQVIVPCLATSDRLVESHPSEKQRIQEFLAKLMIGNSWLKHISREIAGAAIERAGKDIEALAFYERWRDSGVSFKEKAYAERRWVVCKRRQAEREEREGFQNKADGYRADAQKVVARYGWDDSQVAEGFPGLNDFRKSEAKGDVNQLDATQNALKEPSQRAAVRRLGDLEFRHITDKAWVNIDSQDGLRARVFLREQRVESDDVAVSPMSDGIHQCKEWGLAIRWSSAGAVQFKISDDEFSVHYETSDIPG